jgi:hypothetical protein
MKATASSLEALLKSGEGSDIIVHVEGKAFHLHSWLLRLRSPFFKALLEAGSSWKETIENGAVQLQESRSTFALFLPYLYTEKLDWRAREDRPHVDAWEDIVNLCSLAQFLQVDDFQAYLSTDADFERFRKDEIRKFVSDSRSITDVAGLEGFIDTTSRDPFLMQLVDQDLVGMIFRGSSSSDGFTFVLSNSDALDLLFLGDAYDLPVLSREMYKYCTASTGFTCAFNSVFSENSVRAKANKWDGQRLLFVASKIFANIPSSLSDDLKDIHDYLRQGVAQARAGHPHTCLIEHLDDVLPKMLWMRKQASLKEESKETMSRVFEIANELCNEAKGKRPRRGE